MRTAVEALAAVLGGTNSLHTNALDEVLALPSEKAAEIALRTQQVIMEETGVANVADPLGGSWYVEALTDRIEAEAEAIFARIREMGSRRLDDLRHPARHRGRLVHVRDRRGRLHLPAALEKGEKKIVGVNVHTTTVEEPLEILRVSHEVEREQKRVLGAAPGRPRRRRRRRRAGPDGRGRRAPTTT